MLKTHKEILISFSFFFWGLFPILVYVNDDLSVIVATLWRIVFSLPIIIVIYKILNPSHHLLYEIFKYRKYIKYAILCGILNIVSSGLFMYALSSHRILESSFAYFLSPIISFVFAIFVLKERLSKIQKIGIIVAILGVAVRLFFEKELPIIALLMALTFSCYCFLYKMMKAPAPLITIIEYSFVAPIALIILTVIRIKYDLKINSLSDLNNIIYLVVLNLLPLTLVIYNVNKVNFSLLGVMQYIEPSLHFIFAVVVYQETLSFQINFAFLLIWFGIVLFILNHKISILLHKIQNVFLYNKKHKNINIIDENPFEDI